MEAPKTLRRPANWQDFETLCKKLWEEIWQCPETQKNGRIGQNQAGVDIFGIPKNETGYYGIQCKGKSEYLDGNYTHPSLTGAEIDREIEKALSFEPTLKKFYFATTALNDVRVQAYVRKKNMEHKKTGLFEIHLFCWEAIVELIDTHKATYDWYVNSQQYASRSSMALHFGNGRTEMMATPEFKWESDEAIPKLTRKVTRMIDLNYHIGLGEFNKTHPRWNFSYFETELAMKNTGDTPIEQYKIFIDWEGDVVKVNVDEKQKWPLYAGKSGRPGAVMITHPNNRIEITPTINTLVPHDSFHFGNIYVRPFVQFGRQSSVFLKWKLISRNFRDEGILRILVTPGFHNNRPLDGEGRIVDHWILKKNTKDPYWDKALDGQKVPHLYYPD